MRSYLIFILGLVFLFSSVSAANEIVDHSQHEQHSNVKSGYALSKSKDGLENLSEVPKSGKSREAGFDDRYAMESTSALDKLADLCAKGSRGLIMLDRETLNKCGSTPRGLPERHDDKKPESQTSHQH